MSAQKPIDPEFLMAAFNLLANPETFGIGKALAGAIFGTGLMMVVIAGGELFSGNTLMI